MRACVFLPTLVLALVPSIHTPAQPGTLDPTFNPGSGANAEVYCVRYQNDGKIIVGGGFSTFNGFEKHAVARLLPDGALELGFNQGSRISGYVRTVLPTGNNTYIGGNFLVSGTNQFRNLALLNNGFIDETFSADYRPNSDVYSISISSATLLVAGAFNSVGASSRNRITRMSYGGVVDPFFTNTFGENGTWEIAIGVPGGGAYAAGISTTAIYPPVTHIVRYRPDGTLDPSFTPLFGPNDVVHDFEVLPNGQLIIAGNFTEYSGFPRGRLTRINPDGSLDPTFNPDLNFNFTVNAIDADSGGRIICGGVFSDVSGVPRKGIARLLADGTLDPEFDPEGIDTGGILDLVLQIDGRILIVGTFQSIGGVSRNSVARLRGDETVAPGIITQPTHQTVIVHNDATFSVEASGYPLNYQWHRSEIDIPEATNATLQLSNVSLSDADDYSVTISNGGGSITSSNATLTVLDIITIPVAVEAAELAWSAGGDAAWFGQIDVTHDGIDAAVSGFLLNEQSSWVEASLLGPGRLSFWLRVSSEANFDFLHVDLDGVNISSYSGDSGWVEETVEIPDGAHIVRWTYVKDDVDMGGLDQAWLDQVIYAPLQAIRLPEAVDAEYLTWRTGGNGDWYGQSTVHQDGVDAGRSGAITDMQESWMETTITGPGDLSFYWKVWSEENFDFLEFLVGDQSITAISGDQDWAPVTVAIDPGSHTVRWRYIKDESALDGTDTGWVDRIVFNPPGRFTDPLVADETFTTTLLTIIGQAYTVEYSPDLSSWSFLTNFTATVTNTPVEDPNAVTIDATRIYRATSP